VIAAQRPLAAPAPWLLACQSADRPSKQGFFSGLLEGVVRLSLNQEFVDRVEIQRITPEPESTEAGPDAVTYAFRVAAPDQPTQVRFDYEYDKAGPVQGQLRLDGGPQLDFGSFVFP